jgi:hypothetical protein
LVCPRPALRLGSTQGKGDGPYVALASTDQPDIGYAMIFPEVTSVKILFVDIIPAHFRRSTRRRKNARRE